MIVLVHVVRSSNAEGAPKEGCMNKKTYGPPNITAVFGRSPANHLHSIYPRPSIWLQHSSRTTQNNAEQK